MSRRPPVRSPRPSSTLRRLAPGALPPHLLRALKLEHAWTAAAGEALARRIHANGVRGGVLELTTASAAWRQGVGGALPRLAARVAARLPELRITRVRLVVEGEPPGECQPVVAEPEATAPAEPSPPPAPAEPARDRLIAAARRYLERRRSD